MQVNGDWLYERGNGGIFSPETAVYVLLKREHNAVLEYFFWLFCIRSEDCLLKIPRTNWTGTAFVHLKQQIWQTAKWQMMNAIRLTVFTVSTILQASKTFWQRCAMPQPQKWGARENFIRKSEKISPLLSTPRSLCKNKASSCKVWGRRRLQSRHTQAGKKSFSLKEHEEEFGKQEEIFGVCLPSASEWASSFDRRGRVGFKTVWLQRSNQFFFSHFCPLFCLRLSFPLCCAHRPNSALLLLLSALLWIIIRRTKDGILLL